MVQKRRSNAERTAQRLAQLIEGAIAVLCERGYARGYINVMAAIYLTTRLGMAAAVSPDAADLLGRAPSTMRQYVRDYAPAFAAETRHQASGMM